MWAQDTHGYVIVTYLVTRPNQNQTIKYTLAYIREKIIGISKNVQERTQMLNDTFERKDMKGRSPIFFALWNTEIFKFLIEECCPSGVSLLEDRDNNGTSIALCAARNDSTDVLEYIVEKAPSGTDILKVKDDKGFPVFDYARNREKGCKNTRVYKWRSMEFLRELNLVTPEERTCGY